jgi:hypothetical protein
MFKLSMKSPTPSPERQQQASPTVDKNGGNFKEDDNPNSSSNDNNGRSSVPSVLVETSLPQSHYFPGSHSGNNGSRMMSSSSKSLLKSLPPLFLYMETGDYRRAAERAKNHPREVRTWASIKVKSSTVSQSMSTTKRLAIHQACFKVGSKHFICSLHYFSSNKA